MTVGLVEPPARAEDTAPPHSDTPPQTFWLSMCGVGVVGALVQALFIHAMARRTTLWSGAHYVALQADNVVHGQWFVGPAPGHLPTALHPPLPSLLVAIADVANINGATRHMIFFACLFGLAAGLAGVTVRDLAGRRAGVLATLLFVTFPFLWVNPATLGPETVVVVVCTMLLYFSVRFWRRPSVQSAAVIGLCLGLATLTRTDLVAFVVLLALPLGLMVRHTPWPARLRYLGVMAALLVLVVSPWVIRNQLEVGHSAVLSDDYGFVLAGANCPTTATGPLEGWWSAGCTAKAKSNGAGAHLARVYVSHHLGDAVGVAAVRLGRAWNLYRPLQGAPLETAAGRPAWVSRLGLWYFYVLVPVAVGGAVILRRRRVLLFPLLSMILLSSLTAVLAYGDARFMVEADIGLAMLGGVALDAIARGRREAV